MEIHLVENADSRIVCIARMDDDGQVQLFCEFELGGKKVALRFGRFGIVMEVETDLSDGGNAFAVVYDSREVVSRTFGARCSRLVAVESESKDDRWRGTRSVREL